MGDGRWAMGFVLWAVLGFLYGCEEVNREGDCVACVDAEIVEIISLSAIITDDSSTDEMIDEVVRDVAASQLRVAALRRHLSARAENGGFENSFAEIYIAGKSGDLTLVEPLLAIASLPAETAEQVSDDELTSREMNRLGSFSALRRLGAVEALERLYLDAPEYLQTSLLLELHSIDAVRWPMYELPSEILTDYRADESYAKFFEARLAGLPTAGLVVLDDEVTGDDVDDEDYHEDEIIGPPPSIDYLMNEIGNKTSCVATDKPDTIYACGITDPVHPTACEITSGPSWCNSATISAYWNGYKFNSSWDSSMGFDVACSLHKPLGRTFHAIHLLHTASPSPPTSYSDMGGDMLRWGGNYAMREIPLLKASCSTSAFASADRAVLKKNRHVTLMSPFFYERTTATRASSLIHEARHTERCHHNGNDGSLPCRARSASCDESLYDGCTDLVMAPNGAGAVGFQVSWLQMYLAFAPSSRINDFQREEAWVLANDRLNRWLDLYPEFNLTIYGSVYSKPR